MIKAWSLSSEMTWFRETGIWNNYNVNHEIFMKGFKKISGNIDGELLTMDIETSRVSKILIGRYKNKN